MKWRSRPKPKSVDVSIALNAPFADRGPATCEALGHAIESSTAAAMGSGQYSIQTGDYVSNSGFVGGGAAVRLGAFLFVALAGFSLPSAAQQPTSEQISAIRANCRSDYQRYCSSVPAGGSASLQCLEQNSAKLSGACQQAVSAAM